MCFHWRFLLPKTLRLRNPLPHSFTWKTQDRRQDNQHNDTQHNDTQLYNIAKTLMSLMLLVIMLNVIMLGIAYFCYAEFIQHNYYAGWRYDEYLSVAITFNLV